MQQKINTEKYPPSSLVLLLSPDEWESFIEDCCRVLMHQDGKYKHVQQLGGAGDAGRDIEARYTEQLLPRKWDLYQAKHYTSPVGESTLYPELSKVFYHISKNTYPEPNYYYICAPKNTTPSLHDLIARPDSHKEEFLKSWKDGKKGVKKSQFPLTDEVERIVNNFDFARIKEYPIKDLIKIHSRDYEAHEALFGIAKPRGENPPTPTTPSSQEIKYIEELLKIYEEHGGTPMALEDVLVSMDYCDHLNGCRGEFYSAEGLKRFSRDVMPGEFEKLMDSVYVGIKRESSNPRHRTGFDRLDAVLQTATSLQVTDSPLYKRLLPADLPGTCHQLVNEEKLKWVK